jgi:glycosyltransferase involved in cell wall biosynthesis
MRFALLTTTFYPTLGGAEKQLDLLARGLLARGHDPVVIAPLVPGRNNGLDLPYRVHRYPRLRSKRFGLRWHARFLETLHREQPFDLVHAHGAYPAAYMAMGFARRHRLPLIVRAHGGDVLPDEAIGSSPRLRARMQRALAAADVLIAQNEEFVELLGHLSGHPDRVFRIGNGVEIELYQRPVDPNPHPAAPPVALTLSTFYAKKGLDVLLDAWALVLPHHPDAHLHLAGHGPDEGALRERVERLRLTGSVSFLGNIKGVDKTARLQSCAVYVSSARREVFSNALLEAAAAGCRLVATDVGANREVVSTVGNGELVPPDNAPLLAEALDRALCEGRPRLTPEQQRERMTPFSLDTALDRYLDAALTIRRA